MWERTRSRPFRATWMVDCGAGTCGRQIGLWNAQVGCRRGSHAWNDVACSLTSCCLVSPIIIPGMHEGAITSVHFSPVDATKVLTNGMDSCLRIIDLRNGLAVETFRDADLTTIQSWSKAVWSPNGRYVAAGSNAKGVLLVWNSQNGALQKLSTPHSSSDDVVPAGICGVDWGRGGSSGQQVATIDRRGKLILWA